MQVKYSIAAILITVSIFNTTSVPAEDEGRGIWICQPSHWINLRGVGPTLNPGKEPSFTLLIDATHMMIRGEKSWLNESDFEIYDEMTLGKTHVLEGKTEWNSQFVFSDTTGEFFHSSASIGVVVSMVGKCHR